MEMNFPDSRSLVPCDSNRGLRPLGWGELCARLLAAHDTRGALAGAAAASAAEPGLVGTVGLGLGVSGPRGGTGFSFHDSAAALLRSVETHAEEGINPASSGNGNDVGGTIGPVPNVGTKRRPDEN